MSRRFEVLRESLRDIGGYTELLYWIYDPAEGSITLHARQGGEVQASMYETSLREARQRGFTTDQLWTYWGQDGGNGYDWIRTGPIPMTAADRASLARALLGGTRAEKVPA